MENLTQFFSTFSRVLSAKKTVSFFSIVFRSCTKALFLPLVLHEIYESWRLHVNTETKENRPEVI